MKPTKKAIVQLECAIAWLTKMKHEDTKKKVRIRIARNTIKEALGIIGYDDDDEEQQCSD